LNSRVLSFLTAVYAVEYKTTESLLCSEQGPFNKLELEAVWRKPGRSVLFKNTDFGFWSLEKQFELLVEGKHGF
jgi:hypothetical protein